MLAGSEGIGGLAFDNYALAHGIGTVALAIILFDGGLSTPMASVRAAWKPAFVLAVPGVLITAAVTGVAAAWILNIPWLEGMLLGSLVGSTDAAAVFSILRFGGVRLPDRLASTLEIESGSNDPMAIFLTVSLIELLLGRMAPGLELLSLFLRQMSVGALGGLCVGYAAVYVVNRINLGAAGLYPVLVSAFGLLAYGLASTLGGSGFLAVYLAGIIIGNKRIVFQRGIFLFHDASAWLAQIVMFVVLGLLSFPSRLLSVAPQALLIAAALIFVARPLAVVLSLVPFRFRWREQVFLSWVGLKGAVPITLATFPLLAEVQGAKLLFDVVFFVVVISALVQGWSLPVVARKLKLELPADPQAPITVEISSLRHVEGDIADYTVSEDSLAAGRLVRELALPVGAVIAIITRKDKIIPPQGNTQIEPGDHAVLVLSPGTRPLVNKIFARRGTKELLLPPSLEFPLRGTITVGELEEYYNIQMDVPDEHTLDQALRAQLGSGRTRLGAHIVFDKIALYVRGISGTGKIDRVGMVILPLDEHDGGAGKS
jgi:cell volume regulation protein A